MQAGRNGRSIGENILTFVFVKVMTNFCGKIDN